MILSDNCHCVGRLERQVAFNLLQVIGNTGKKHSPYRAGKTEHTRHPTAGVQTTYSIWDQLKNASLDDNNDLVIAGRSLRYIYVP